MEAGAVQSLLMATSIRSRWAFLRLWFVLFFSYFGVKFIFNLGLMGYIDLRPVAFSELVLVPLGQSVVFWLVTRRSRRGAAAAPTDVPS
jgi:hypothetical protein